MCKHKKIQKNHVYFLLLFLFSFLILTNYRTAYATANVYRYNIRDFGANGSDKKADNDAIQEALDKSSEEYKIEVIVPPGTYYISKTLYIQSNTTLTLQKGATIIRNQKGITDYMLKCSDKNHKYKGHKKYNLAHDITVRGGTWDGGKIKKADETSNLLYFGHAQNINIHSTTIKNCFGNHAIEFAGVCNSVIRNCYITGFRYDTDNFTSEAIQLDVCYKDSQYGSWAPGFEADKTPCKNILIEKNTIVDYPRGVGVHHSLKKKYCSDIIIRKNKFLRSSPDTQYKCSSAVFMMGARNVTITSNIVDHYYYGALIKSCKNISFKKNTFDHTGVCGITMDGCNQNNGTRRFNITNKKRKRKLQISCPYIRKGSLKTRGVKYSFTSPEGKTTVKLQKKPKKGQEIEFYGVDVDKNKYYQTIYIK